MRTSFSSARTLGLIAASLLAGISPISLLHATDVTLDGQGYLYLEQLSPNTVTIPDETTAVLNNNRFFWNPVKGALRFGDIDYNLGSYLWKSSMIGDHSFSAGTNTSAYGSYSFAFGEHSNAYGNASFALGKNTESYGNSSFAFGEGAYAEGQHSIVIGQGYAWGLGSVVLGDGSNEEGDYATAIHGSADGDNAIAINGSAYGASAIALQGGAEYEYSIAIGKYSNARAAYAVALGSNLTSGSEFGTAIGRFNLNKKKDGITYPAFGLDDPIFEIGNGSSFSARSNALTVYRDGTTRLNGPLELATSTGVVRTTLTSAATAAQDVTFPDASGTVLLSGSASNIGSVGIGAAAIGSNYTAASAPANGIIVEGNVGIGTPTPGAKLAVDGTVNITGNATLSSALTVAGQLNAGATNYFVNNAIDGEANLIRLQNDNLGTNAAVKISFDGKTTVGNNYDSIAEIVLGKRSAWDTINNRTSSFKVNVRSKDTLHSGLYLTGDDNSGGSYFSVSPNGTERLRVVGTSGNVGIGTTTPGVTLDVDTAGAAGNGTIRASGHQDSIYPEGRFVARASRGTAAVPAAILSGDRTALFSSQVYSGTQYITPASIDMYVNGTVTSSSVPTDIVFSTGAEGTRSKRLVVTSTGQVGIGTPTPSSLLNISANTAGDAVLTIEADTNDSAELDNTWIRFKQDGGQTVANVGLIQGTTDAFGSVVTDAASNAYMIQTSGSDIQFANSSTVLATINNASGNLGIGTNAPAAKLDVNGNALVRGSLQMSDAVGAIRTTLASSATANRTINFPDASGTVLISSPTLAVNAGTAGDAVLTLEADTDDNSESDNAWVRFKQDAGLTVVNTGLAQGANYAFGNTVSGATNDAYMIQTSGSDIQFANTTSVLATISGSTGTLKVNSGRLATTAISRIDPIVLRGAGWNDPVSRLVTIGGTQIAAQNNLSTSRGLALTIINKADHTHVSSAVYDTYTSSSTTASENLTIALNGMTDLQIGILTSYDSWESNVTDELRTAFARLGLTKAQLCGGSRAPYAAIFEGASAGKISGKAVEVIFPASSVDPTAQPFAEIRGWLMDGSYVVTPPTVANALYNSTSNLQAVLVDRAGGVAVKTTFRVPERGDLSMGNFKSGLNPLTGLVDP